MKLTTLTQTFKAHFWHDRDSFGRWRTRVRLHAGPCEGTPCAKSYAVAGEARCSFTDIFCKATGRKLALARALKTMARDMRREIWLAYWAVSKPPRSCKASQTPRR